MEACNNLDLIVLGSFIAADVLLLCICIHLWLR